MPGNQQINLVHCPQQPDGFAPLRKALRNSGVLDGTFPKYQNTCRVHEHAITWFIEDRLMTVSG